jgi:hypothetical protein
MANSPGSAIPSPPPASGTSCTSPASAQLHAGAARPGGSFSPPRPTPSSPATSFDAVFRAAEIEILKTPPQAPKANAHCERVIGTLRREVLDHILAMNATDAHLVLTKYARHYNQHRPYQARNQRPPDAITLPATIPHHNHSRVLRTRVLGGLINEYHHAA